MTKPESSLWLAHHWPESYAERCVKIGKQHVCKRCLALYPIGFVVAFAGALGYLIWPNTWDPIAIWLLCIPGSIAYIGEAVGLFTYRTIWQTAATAITAIAFGKALSYELLERWSPEFWTPLTVFGLIWFTATIYSHNKKSEKKLINSLDSEQTIH